MSSSRRLVLTSLLLASGLGCATARNYEDPAAPVYKGGVADRRDAGATLRVVTFNLKWGKEIDRAVELLSRPGPLRGADLVVLEEMDRGGHRAARPRPRSGVRLRAVGGAPRTKARLRCGAALAVAARGATQAAAPASEPDAQAAPLGRRRDAALAARRGPRLRHPFREPGRRVGQRAARPGARGARRRRGLERARAGGRRLQRPRRPQGDGEARLLLGDRGGAEHGRPFEFDHVVARGLCASGEQAMGVAPDSNRASDHKPVWAVFARCGDMMAAANDSR